MSDLDSLLLMGATLAKDVEAAENRIVTEGNQIARRDYVRALFAYFEGMCYLLRQVALDKYTKGELTAGLVPIISVLGGHTVEVEENGEITTKGQLRLSLPKTLSLSFRYFSESLGITFQLNKGGSEYQSFTAGVKIRDRITHPKALSDLEVSGPELDILRCAYQWFHSNIEQIYRTHTGTP